MTEDISKFSNLVLKAKGYVTYGDNLKGKILGIGKVGAPPFTSIEDVLYVEGLKYNLLSISQLCDKGFKIKFTKDECLIEDEANHEVKLIGKRINNIFINFQVFSLPFANNKWGEDVYVCFSLTIAASNISKILSFKYQGGPFIKGS